MTGFKQIVVLSNYWVQSIDAQNVEKAKKSTESSYFQKSGLNSVPSEPIWRCNIISMTTLKGFLSVHATKNEGAETFKNNSGYMNVWRVTNNFLIFTLSKTAKYVLQWWMKKVWPYFCPFRPFSRVQNIIPDIFERFSISSCNKKWRHRKPSRKIPAIFSGSFYNKLDIEPGSVS